MLLIYGDYANITIAKTPEWNMLKTIMAQANELENIGVPLSAFEITATEPVLQFMHLINIVPGSGELSTRAIHRDFAVTAKDVGMCGRLVVENTADFAEGDAVLLGNAHDSHTARDGLGKPVYFEGRRRLCGYVLSHVSGHQALAIPTHEIRSNPSLMPEELRTALRIFSRQAVLKP
jgi:hypothetical protein